jgi:hypothetical protein
VAIVCAGPELDGDAAALAVAPPVAPPVAAVPRVAVVPPVADDLELPEEQPVSASRAAVPQAAIAAPALAVPRLLIMCPYVQRACQEEHRITRKDALTVLRRNLLMLYFAAVQI